MEDLKAEGGGEGCKKILLGWIYKNRLYKTCIFYLFCVVAGRCFGDGVSLATQHYFAFIRARSGILNIFLLQQRLRIASLK